MCDTATCWTCGGSFDLTVPNRRYCSKQCRDDAKWLKRPQAACEICGASFHTRLANPRFCSARCRIAGTPRPVPQAAPPRECVECGAAVPRERRKFCTLRCGQLSLRPWLACSDCNGIFRAGKAYAASGRCRSCRLRWYSGRFRKGASYKGVKERLRRLLREREEGVCQDCGMAVGDQFHAHHIVPQSLGGSSELDNLRLLCEDCHQGDGWYRNHWELVWLGKATAR